MTYELHPLAGLFPAMPDADREEMKQSIAKDGLSEPIVLFMGRILDGQHRLAICRELGIEPAYREYTGDDPLAYAIKANLLRRHLTISQRAAIAAEIANMPVGNPNFGQKPQQTPIVAKVTGGETAQIPLISQTEASKIAQVDRVSVNKAVAVKKADPQLHEQVKVGEVSLNKAVKAVRKKSDAEVIRCQTGAAIPSDLVEIWNRRGEVKQMMGTITSIVNRLREAQQANDPLFLPIHFASAISKLEYARQEISAGLPHAVCTSCQGRGRDHCTHCKGIGFLSKLAWGMVPEDIRKFRSTP